jgi:hypothetical protein
VMYCSSMPACSVMGEVVIRVRRVGWWAAGSVKKVETFPRSGPHERSARATLRLQTWCPGRHAQARA